ncbi:hypothetical protein AOLI_G00178540 [Acnodon oligacanthus]
MIADLPSVSQWAQKHIWGLQCGASCARQWVGLMSGDRPLNEFCNVEESWKSCESLTILERNTQTSKDSGTEITNEGSWKTVCAGCYR